jgi:hypothetical protein
MPVSRARLAMFVAIAAALGGAAELLRPARVPALPAEPGPGGPAATSSSSSGAPARIAFSPRQRRRYVYAFERSILLGDWAANVPELSYSGRLTIDVLARGAEVSAIAFTRLEGHPSSPPVLARISDEGRSLVLATSDTEESPSDPDREQLAILKDLLALWVFPLEQDTVGRYTAAFGRLSDDGSFPRETKSKLAYLDPRAPAIAASTHRATWNRALGVPLELSGEESTRLGEGKLAMSSRARYRLRLVSESAAETRSVVFDHPEPLAISPHGRRPARETSPWPELARRFAGAPTLSASEQLRLFGELVASLRARPATAGRLLALLAPALLRQGSSSPEFKLAVGSLATAASPEAQSALRTLYSDADCAASGRGTILAALTTTQAPLSEATREFLAEQARAEDTDLATGAELASGAALRNAGSDPTALAAIQQLEEAWAAGGTETRKRDLLDAMGNSGRAEFFPIVSQVVSGDDPALRNKAIFALRFMRNDSATSLLASELTDPDPNARAAAASAIALSQQASSTR